MTPASFVEAMPGKNLFARIHIWIRQHKRQSFLLAALCWGAMALVATRMHTDASSMAFFPDAAPEIRQMAEALDVSPASRLLFINISTTRLDGKYALARTADAVLNDVPADLAERAGMFTMPDPGKLLTLLPFLTDAAALEFFLSATREEHVDAAIHAAHNSLNSLFSSATLAWLRADPLAFRQVLLSRLPALEADLLPDPLLGYPVSQDGRNLLLMLRPKHSLHDVRAAVRLMDSVQEALQAHMQPDMHSLVVGGHRHSAANTQVIEHDVTRILILSLSGFVLIYLLLVRSKGAFWLLLVPVFAATVALGGMTLFVPVLSALALGFGASVLGIADDYAVHMHFALRSGRDPGAVLQMIAVPLFQGYLINAVGFVVLLLSGIPAIRQLAGLALLAISVGFVLAVTILPVSSSFAKPVLQSSQYISAPRRPVAWRVVVTVAVLLALCCVFFANIRVDVSPRTMGADMAQLQEDASRLQSIWGSQDKEMLVVQAQGRETALSLARDTVALLRQQEPENTISTLTDIWPSPEQRRENLHRWTEFVREHGEELKARVRAAARKYGFTEDAFAPFEQILALPETELTPELFRAAGLGILLDTFLHESAQGSGKTTVLLPTREKFDISRLPQQLRAHVLALSPEALETAMMKQFNQEKRLVPLAWLACFSLLFICFRNIRSALLASLPPLCSITCILAWMAFTGTPLTLAAMAALPLVLGLAANHGIMVTHDLAHGIDIGLRRAILVASLTALTSMGLLALAHHPALKALGQVIFLGLLVEIPASLWLLPRLCRAEAAPSAGCSGSAA